MSIDNFEVAQPGPISFRLDSHTGVPTFRQLVQQVEHALQLGYLKQGDQLPTVKEVASSLLINPNTVLKAYRELEQKGIARGRPGQGTFIEVSTKTMSLVDLNALREDLVDGWLRKALQSGLGADSISALFASALRDLVESNEGVASDDRGDDENDVVA